MANESNYTCCCNLHVRKGALGIAIAEIILAILIIVYCFHVGAFFLVAFGIRAFYCIYYVIKLPEYIKDDFDNSIEARLYYIGVFIGTVIFIVVYAYCWTVIYRAFRYMRDVVECECRNEASPVVVYGPPTQGYPQAVNQTNTNAAQPPNVLPQAGYQIWSTSPYPQQQQGYSQPSPQQQQGYSQPSPQQQQDYSNTQQPYGHQYDTPPPPPYQTTGQENFGFKK
uniref:Uncharacterized protein n=1 Tax=Acrobeloides nanus TaxID=290746 RepID=A0A914BUZ1_9BILA